MKNTLHKYQIPFILFILTYLGVLAAAIYLANGETLLYGDAVSRLNISRKITDNLTPGAGQIGNVWLPLPQVMMIPLTMNNFLWHSGIAGALLSVLSFILGGYFVFKSGFLITKSFAAGLFGTLVYALNINLLYLQTTAMSEAIFIAALSAIMYFFLAWFYSQQKSYLLFAALAMSAMCLIRYEGLALLLVSIPMVFVASYFSTKKYSEAEGSTVIYATLACVGFGLWTIYLAIIFKDPFYWINYYAGGSSSTEITTAAANAVVQESGLFKLFGASWKYFTSMVWMMGVPAIIFSFLGIIRIIYHSIAKRTLNLLLPMALPLAIFLFMIATLMKNTPIQQPDLTLVNILSAKTSMEHEFNIRYGILLLPWAGILAAYVFGIRNIFLRIVLVIIFALQLVTYINPVYTAIFHLPTALTQGGNKGTGNDEAVAWLKQNYDDGLILVSALKHDPQMFWLELDYKNYIHEGTQKYWKDSLVDPTKHAKWIILSEGNKSDPVYKSLSETTILQDSYDLVHQFKDTRIYKIK